ncbi:uncharacterized protein VTP21DRAFT_8192 [Calcarisporiella thermophila]|uniref:uncharacterized protein n=1 Tax=Calcarisporiella thermophila TaxID=911321 RepID=UPI00374361E8
MSLRGKTLFITGASRGIGLAIALRAARDGANVAIAAKTTTPHPKLPGTIYTAADEIKKAGGNALPVVCDIRDEDQVKSAIQQTVDKFGGIDIVVNNASAISLTNTQNTTFKKYNLMNEVNARGTWLVSKYAIPHLIKSKNPHILMISPPPSMSQVWFRNHVAYTIAKMGMSMCVLGLSGELEEYGVGVNALWPLTMIDTAALQILGEKLNERSRTPEIMADAAYAVFIKNGREFNGNFLVDEVFLREEGVTDFEKYASVPGSKEIDLDLFVGPEILDKVEELRQKQGTKSKL